MQPDRVLLAVMDDRMIAKGLVLHWVTAFFQDYLATESLDDLVALLRKTRLDTRLMEFFPPHKRTLADFDEHFKVGPCSWVGMAPFHTLDMANSCPLAKRDFGPSNTLLVEHQALALGHMLACLAISRHWTGRDKCGSHKLTSMYAW